MIIRIVLSANVSPEIFEYINDCWVEFITCDLGLKPSDAIMILPE